MLNVIIPTYKARHTLSNALDSLVAQTKKMFLVTIVQDCDGEDYSDIIEEYRRRGLHINLLQTPKNGGPGVARQYGIDHSKMCDYIMFLDADDMLNPRATEVLYKEAKKSNLDLLSSSFIAEKVGDPDIYLDVESTSCTWTHGKIYRLNYLREKNIRFLDDLRLNEDSYFNLVAHNCTANKASLKEYTYIWREQGNSLTRMKESFFSRSWVMYVQSQVDGLLKIQEILGELNIELVGMTFLNIYYHVQKAAYYNYSFDELIPLLNKLRESKEIQDVLNTDLFWRVIVTNIKGASVEDKTVIFHSQRFPDWLNEYITDKEYQKEKEEKNEELY